MRNLVKYFAAVALMVLATSTFATDPTITDVGNAEGYISAAITALGSLAGVVFGGFFAFWLVKKAMAWAGRIG